MLNHIIDRLHVGASNRDVIRAVRRRLRASALTRTNRTARHRYYRDALARHRHNQNLYIIVLRGGL